MFLLFGNACININNVIEFGFRDEETCWVRFVDNATPTKTIGMSLTEVLDILRTNKIVLAKEKEV